MQTTSRLRQQYVTIFDWELHITPTVNPPAKPEVQNVTNHPKHIIAPYQAMKAPSGLFAPDARLHRYCVRQRLLIYRTQHPANTDCAFLLLRLRKGIFRQRRLRHVSDIWRLSITPLSCSPLTIQCTSPCSYPGCLDEIPSGTSE